MDGYPGSALRGGAIVLVVVAFLMVVLGVLLGFAAGWHWKRARRVLIGATVVAAGLVTLLLLL